MKLIALPLCKLWTNDNLIRSRNKARS